VARKKLKQFIEDSRSHDTARLLSR
jgi:hypothetical protein